MSDTFGVAILAGGEATRLPGKLLLAVADDDARDVPMLVRVLAQMRDAGPREIVIAAKSTFPAEIDALLDVPLAIDRWPGRGPLAGMLTAMACMRSRFVFAVAGDAPNLTATFARDLATHLAPGVEAIVPSGAHGRIEPLAALYDRLSFVRAGLPVLRSGHGSLRRVIAELDARYVPIANDGYFANINTPADYASVRDRRP